MRATSSGFGWAASLTVALTVAALSATTSALAAQGQGGQQRQAAQEERTQPAPGAMLEPADELKIPTGSVWLGTVRIPRAVMADGKPLPAGRYRVRLTGEHAEADAVGQAEQLERWVEFVQGDEVRGREMAPVVPSPAVEEVAEAKPPRSGAVRVEALKEEDEYVRLWFNHQGDQVLVYLPYANGS